MASADIKPTLQLRHQLCANGIRITAAAYDTRRHHLLTYDHNPLAPHTLRLFSLRREIRMAALFDADNPPPAAVVATGPSAKSPSPPKTAASPATGLSLELLANTGIDVIRLFFSPPMDVFVCVYSAYAGDGKRRRHELQPRPAPTAPPPRYHVLFLEPASLRKLVFYPGPSNRMLCCAHVDPTSTRIVLGARIHHPPRPASRSGSIHVITAAGHSHAIDILDVSKRPFRSGSKTPAETEATTATPTVTRAPTPATAPPPDRIMLCVEHHAETLWLRDPIDCVAAAPRIHRLFAAGPAIDANVDPSGLGDDDIDDDDDGTPTGINSGGVQLRRRRRRSSTASTGSVVLEWREDAQGALVLLRRIVHGDTITTMVVHEVREFLWLFTGHSHGGLKLWSLGGPLTRGDPLTFTPVDGRHPGGAIGTIALDTVAVSSDAAGDLPDAGREVMVFTTGQGDGHIHHWRFAWPDTEDDDPFTHPRPRLELLGLWNLDGHQEDGAALSRSSSSSSLKLRHGPVLPICVRVNTSAHASERLVVVTRDDLVHVLKVQTILQVLYRVPVGHTIVATRHVDPEGHRLHHIVALCGGHNPHLWISVMDDEATERMDPSEHPLLPPPATTTAQRHAARPPEPQRITSMDTLLDPSGLRILAYGWSSGIVEVYAISTDVGDGVVRHLRIALLQDPQLDAEITAVTILRVPSASSSSSSSSTSSSTGLVVVGGSSRGELLGWRIRLDPGRVARLPPPPPQFVLEATVRWPHAAAHSTHVVGLTAALPAGGAGGSPTPTTSRLTLLSLSADGLLKLWAVPPSPSPPSPPQLVGVLHTTTTGPSTALSHRGRGAVLASLGDRHVAVGFDDGALGLWRREPTTSDPRAWGQLAVSGGQHERRITRITPLTSRTSDPEERFLTASLDMVVILWGIHPTAPTVTELRFFDLGAPVLDCCVLGAIAFVALERELCWFQWRELEPTRVIDTARTPRQAQDEQEEAAKEEEEERMMVGDGTAAASSAPSSSSLLQPPAPLALDQKDADKHAQGPASDAPPSPTSSPLRASTSPTSPSKDESVINIPSVLVPEGAAAVDLSASSLLTLTSPPTTTTSALAPWRTLPGSHEDDEDEDGALDPAVLGTYVRHFITTRGTHGTVAAETLEEFTVLHRLPGLRRRRRVAGALRQWLQEHRQGPRDRLDAETATRVLCELQQRLRARPPKGGDAARDRDRVGTGDAPAATTDAKPRRQPRAASQQRRRVPVVSYNAMGERAITWREDNGPVVDTPDAATDSHHHHRRHERQRPRPRSPSPWDGPVGTWALDEELVQRLHLSPAFARHWSSRGVCWCPTMPLLVRRGPPHRTPANDDGDDKAKATTKDPPPRCPACRRRRHVLELTDASPSTMFPLRRILTLIAEVYARLAGPAHASLFKQTAATAADNDDGVVSIHGALVEVLTGHYGAPEVVEAKLPLLCVAMCAYVREVDAVAVFGELLGLFAPDEPVPEALVAVCAAAHGWLHAREMVVAGAPILAQPQTTTTATTTATTTVTATNATHWGFVRLPHALHCARELLVYPLVSPGFLHNVLMYLGDFAQAEATVPNAAAPETETETEGPAAMTAASSYVELHRFLRLLVGEWRQEATAFRLVERLLFVEPLTQLRLRHAQADKPRDKQPHQAEDDEQEEQVAALVGVLDKLRLLLSCLVFYDPERRGVAPPEDFAAILRRLKYLWPNEALSEREAAGQSRAQDSLTFENTLVAARRRFGDVEHEGHVGYLDFWALLYVVGVRARALLKFREIPGFCRDYKLEIPPELRRWLVTYMQHSSGLLLPRGFARATSTTDEDPEHQHRRRVAGLHDGHYVVSTTRGDLDHHHESLALEALLLSRRHDHGDKDVNADARQQQQQQQQQQLLASVEAGLYVDGTTPALRRSPSDTAALDTYEPLTHHNDLERTPPMTTTKTTTTKTTTRKALLSAAPPPLRTREDARPVATLSQSTLDGTALRLGRDQAVNTSTTAPLWRLDPSAMAAPPRNEPPTASIHPEFTNVYIQFPYVPPHETRVPCASTRALVAVGDDDDETRAWTQSILHQAHARGVAPGMSPAASPSSLPEDARASTTLPSGTTAAQRGRSPTMNREGAADVVVVDKRSRPTRPQEQLTIEAPRRPSRSPLSSSPSPSPLASPHHGGRGAPTVETMARRLPSRERRRLHGLDVDHEPEHPPQGQHESAAVASAVDEDDDHDDASATPEPNAEEPMVQVANADDDAEDAEAKAEAGDDDDDDDDDDEVDSEGDDEVAEGVHEGEDEENDAGHEATGDDDDGELMADADVEALVLEQQQPAEEVAPAENGPDELATTSPTGDGGDDRDDESEEERGQAPGRDEALTDPADYSHVDDPEKGPSPEPSSTEEPPPPPSIDLGPVERDRDAPPPPIDAPVAAPPTSTRAPSIAEMAETTAVAPALVIVAAPASEAAATAAAAGPASVPTATTPPSPSPSSPSSPSPRDRRDSTARGSAPPPSPPSPPRSPLAKPIEALRGVHRFKFTQQPAFRSTAAMNTNPFRSGAWRPADAAAEDDDDDDEDQDDRGSKDNDHEDEDAENEAVGIEDMRLRLSPDAAAALRRAFPFGPALQHPGMKTMGLAALAFGTPVSGAAGAAAAAKVANRLGPPRGRAQQLATATTAASTKLGAQHRHLDAHAERALYGEPRDPGGGGGGIDLSPEAAAAMHERWAALFARTETAMFAPLRASVAAREAAQRREEALQTRLLRRSREGDGDGDGDDDADDDGECEKQRGEASDRIEGEPSSPNVDDAVVAAGAPGRQAHGADEDQGRRRQRQRRRRRRTTTTAAAATFRVRRLTRERCRQLQHELRLGDVAHGELPMPEDVRYFHYYHRLPRGHGPPGGPGDSIVTLKLHVLHGDAEFFVSTATLAPCASDFMWRSTAATVPRGDEWGVAAAPDATAAARTAAAAETDRDGVGAPDLDPDPGHKLVLYPHDLARAMAMATPSTTTTAHEEDAREPEVVALYVAVVARAPQTSFTLGVMAAGQKTAPSRALATVDALIAKFQRMAQSIEHATAQRETSAQSSMTRKTTATTTTTTTTSMVERMRALLAVVETADARTTAMMRSGLGLEAPDAAALDASDAPDPPPSVITTTTMRDGVQNATEDPRDDDRDAEDDDDTSASFQQLLEALGARHRGPELSATSPSRGQATSRGGFILDGPPSAEVREFLEDEEARLGRHETEGEGHREALAVATDRRLSQASAKRLARLTQLPPPPRRRNHQHQHHQQQQQPPQSLADASSESVSLRVARAAPKLVAYSLSTLPAPSKTLGHAPQQRSGLPRATR